jgi:Bacterial PH domain
MEFQDSVHGELGSDEQLLWIGAPKTGLRLRPSDAVLIPFSLVWGGFAIYWEYTVVHQTRSKGGGSPADFLELWGIPFVVVGLYFIFGRFFVDAYVRARTHYAVTNQRVLIVTSLWSKQVKSLSLRTLSEMSIHERPDGSGTITFGPGSPANQFTLRSSAVNSKGPPVFEFVDGVRAVYDVIRQAQESRRS